MVSSKIEYEFDPYRRKVMRALCLTKLSGTDFRVLLFLLGQTDGYHRTQDDIKPAFFVECTGVDKGNIRRSIARLRKWHMITKNRRIYEVLPPDQWDKDVFVETKTRLNLEAVLAEEDTGKRINLEAETLPSTDQNRFNLEAPSASDLKRSEVKIEAVLASPKEHYLKNTTKEEGVVSTPPIKRGTKKKNYYFDNILLSEDEYQKLVKRFGEAGTKDRLEALSLYKKSRGKRYASDYATVLSWAHRERKEGGQSGTYRQGPQQLRPRDSYTKPEDYGV